MTLTPAESHWLATLGEIDTWALVRVSALQRKDPAERPESCLARLVALGLAERDPLGGGWRITDAGRAELRRTAV